MKKGKIRKLLAVLLAVCMVVQLGGMSNAVGDESYTEIVLGCDVDCEKAQLIIDLLNGETSSSEFQPITPSSIWCVLGHAWANTTAVEINHRVFPAPLRCRQTTYSVDYCTRSSCNHVVMTQLTQFAIHCCT